MGCIPDRYQGDFKIPDSSSHSTIKAQKKYLCLGRQDRGSLKASPRPQCGTGRSKMLSTQSNTDMGQGLKHPHLVFCIIGMVRKYESLERECICRGSAVRRRDNRIATGTKDQGIRQDVIHFGRC